MPLCYELYNSVDVLSPRREHENTSTTHMRTHSHGPNKDAKAQAKEPQKSRALNMRFPLSRSQLLTRSLGQLCALFVTCSARFGSAQLGSSLVAAPGPILNVCAPRQYRYRTLCPRLRRRRRIAAALRCALRSKSTPGRWVRTGARTRASWSDSGSGSCLCSCVLSRLEKCRLIAITESKSERKNERKKKQSD